MKKNKGNTKNLILNILILSIVWLLYSMVFNSYSYLFSIPFFLVYVSIFLLLSFEKKFYIILFTLPFAAIFKFSDGLPSFLIVLMFVYIFQILLTRTVELKKIEYVIIIFFVLIQFISLSIYNGSYVNLLSFILNIIFLKVCATYFGEIKNNSIFLINSTFFFSSSMILSIIIADIYPEISYIISIDKHALLMTVNRFPGLNADPNYYSQLVLVAICLGIATLLTSKKNIANIFIIVMVCFLLFNGFRSISKNYVLSIGLILMMSAYYYNLVSKSRGIIFVQNSSIKILKMGITFSVGIVALLILIVNIIIPTFESRTDSEDILTGRVEIWIHYLELIALKPEILISGVGFLNDAQVLGETFGIFMSPHNIYLEIIIGCGVIGSLLLLVLFKNFFIDLRSKVRSPYFMYIVIIFFTSLGLSLSSNDALFILLPLVRLLKNNRNIGVKKNEKISNSYSNPR